MSFHLRDLTPVLLLVTAVVGIRNVIALTGCTVLLKEASHEIHKLHLKEKYHHRTYSEHEQHISLVVTVTHAQQKITAMLTNSVSKLEDT